MASVSRWRLSWLLVISVIAGLLTPDHLLAQSSSDVASEPLPASTVIEYNPRDQTLTVQLRALPLGQLLRLLTEETGVRFRLFPSAAQSAGQVITRSFDRVPLERALKQLVGRANSAMVYTSQRDSSGHIRVVLTEVQILGVGEQVEPIITSRPRTTPLRADRPTPLHRSNPPPVIVHQPLSPSEQDARRIARRKMKKEEKENAQPKSAKRRSDLHPRSGKAAAPTQAPVGTDNSTPRTVE